jgi:hypothetical protein
MPLYTYQCNDCLQIREEFFTIAEMEEKEARGLLCDNCPLGKFERVFKPKRHVKFHEDFYEHVGVDGVHCSNAKQLQDACERNGVTSHYLADMGSLFGVKSRLRWV